MAAQEGAKATPLSSSATGLRSAIGCTVAVTSAAALGGGASTPLAADDQLSAVLCGLRPVQAPNPQRFRRACTELPRSPTQSRRCCPAWRPAVLAPEGDAPFANLNNDDPAALEEEPTAPAAGITNPNPAAAPRAPFYIRLNSALPCLQPSAVHPAGGSEHDKLSPLLPFDGCVPPLPPALVRATLAAALHPLAALPDATGGRSCNAAWPDVHVPSVPRGLPPPPPPPPSKPAALAPSRTSSTLTATAVSLAAWAAAQQQQQEAAATLTLARSIQRLVTREEEDEQQQQGQDVTPPGADQTPADALLAPFATLDRAFLDTAPARGSPGRIAAAAPPQLLLGAGAGMARGEEEEQQLLGLLAGGGAGAACAGGNGGEAAAGLAAFLACMSAAAEGQQRGGADAGAEEERRRRRGDPSLTSLCCSDTTPGGDAAPDLGSSWGSATTAGGGGGSLAADVARGVDGR